MWHLEKTGSKVDVEEKGRTWGGGGGGADESKGDYNTWQKQIQSKPLS